MSNRKISALTDGGAIQPTDEFIVARGGANYKILGSAVASLPVGATQMFTMGPYIFSFDDDLTALAAGVTVFTAAAGDIIVPFHERTLNWDGDMGNLDAVYFNVKVGDTFLAPLNQQAAIQTGNFPLAQDETDLPPVDTSGDAAIQTVLEELTNQWMTILPGVVATNPFPKAVRVINASPVVIYGNDQNGPGGGAPIGTAEGVTPISGETRLWFWVMRGGAGTHPAAA